MPPLGHNHALGIHPTTSKGGQIYTAGPSSMRAFVHWKADPTFPLCPHPTHMRTRYARREDHKEEAQTKKP